MEEHYAPSICVVFCLSLSDGFGGYKEYMQTAVTTVHTPATIDRVSTDSPAVTEYTAQQQIERATARHFKMLLAYFMTNPIIIPPEACIITMTHTTPSYPTRSFPSSKIFTS